MAAGMHRLVSALHRVRGDLAGMVSACLQDPARRAAEALRLARALLTDPALRTRRALIGEAVVANLAALAAESARETALLMAEALPAKAGAAARLLRATPETHFEYLRALFRLSSSSRGSQPDGDGSPGVDAGGVRGMLDAKAQEEYVGLMCKFAPRDILAFLVASDGYSLERCLKAVTDAGVTPAAAYLLERMGATEEGMLMIRNDLAQKMGQLRESMALGGGVRERQEATRAVQDAAGLAVEVCSRSAARLQGQQTDALWFALLDTFVSARLASDDALHPASQPSDRPASGLNDGPASGLVDEPASGRTASRGEGAGRGGEGFGEVVDSLIRNLVSSMLGKVRVEALIGLLLTSHPGVPLARLRTVLVPALDSLRFQRQVLGAAHEMQVGDTSLRIDSLVSEARRAAALLGQVSISPDQTIAFGPPFCSASGQLLRDLQGGAVAFWNGQAEGGGARGEEQEGGGKRGGGGGPARRRT
ncbi:hypothetical protein T484DRAFT_1969653 [Baffinella frigidus]|nr:hypothetical protein T484DRAFT_1969653 [Cryptophyta sp. CCMP2293]